MFFRLSRAICLNSQHHLCFKILPINRFLKMFSPPDKETKKPVYRLFKGAWCHTGRGTEETAAEKRRNMNDRMYLGNSCLQYHIVDRQGRRIEHGHHHDQHVGSAGRAVRSKVEKHSNAVLVVGGHRQHFTWQQMRHSQSGTAESTSSH